MPASRDHPITDVAAWTKSKDDKPYYSLSIGGLNGAMFPETEKRNEQSPDYTGSLGPNRELRVAGWKRAAEGTGEALAQRPGR